MITDYKTAIENIRRILGNYLEDNKIKSLVLGVSGGIDSALCAALAKPVCDSLNIPLIGRSITIQTNKDDEIKRADGIGKSFCTDFSSMELNNLYISTRNTLLGTPPPESTTKYKVDCGNLKARLRMMKLYSLASIKEGIVLSTDNYTELLAGFWTLHGDVGDFGMIQNLWKTEVYDMALFLTKEFRKDTSDRLNRSLSLKACIKATPTDGLGITNSDLDQLGVPTYAEADKIFQEYLSEETPTERALELEAHPLIQRYLKTQFKRNNPFNIERECITDTKLY